MPDSLKPKPAHQNAPPFHPDIFEVRSRLAIWWVLFFIYRWGGRVLLFR
ncbi:hypothetical protein [Coleofasciculus chthonoplastes]